MLYGLASLLLTSLLLLWQVTTQWHVNQDRDVTMHIHVTVYNYILCTFCCLCICLGTLSLSQWKSYVSLTFPCPSCTLYFWNVSAELSYSSTPFCFKPACRLFYNKCWPRLEVSNVCLLSLQLCEERLNML